jgi:hypothetical protein
MSLPVKVAAPLFSQTPSPLFKCDSATLGGPAVLRSAFERFGFRDVAVEIVPSSQRFASVDAAMEHRRNSLPEMRPFLERMSEAEREAVWEEIAPVIKDSGGVADFYALGVRNGVLRAFIPPRP